MKSPPALLLLTFGLTAFAPLAFPEPLTVEALAERILSADSTVAIAEQSLRAAMSGYRGIVAQALPQISAGSGYALQYTPEVTSIAQQTTPPYFIMEEYRDKGSQYITTSLSLSQILPTGGSLSLSAENKMDVQTGELESGGGFSAMEPEFSQSPKLSLAVKQPMFLNRKALDWELFPATVRKARIGYLKEQAAGTDARNRALAQGFSLFYTVIELRRSLTVAGMSRELTAARLRNLEQSYRLGAASETDVWEMRIAAGGEEEQALELRYRLAQAEMSLSQSLGVDSLEAFELEDGVPRLSFPHTLEQAGAEALTAHPLIVQNGLSLEEKSIDRILGGQAHAANVSLAFSLAPRYPNERTDTSFGGSISELFGTTAGIDYSLSLGASIPLYSGGKKAADEQASLALEAIAAQNLSIRRKAVASDVRSLFIKKENLEAKARLLEDNAELARRRLQMEEELLALGKSTDLDVLSRQIELERKRIEAWRARADLYLDILELYRSMGRELREIVKGQQR